MKQGFGVLVYDLVAVVIKTAKLTVSKRKCAKNRSSKLKDKKKLSIATRIERKRLVFEENLWPELNTVVNCTATKACRSSRIFIGLD